MKKIAITVAGAVCSLVFITGCGNSKDNGSMDKGDRCMPDKDAQCDPYDSSMRCEDN